MINYGGCEPLSTVDYPGRSCITIFLRGCSRRCPWCHNKELQDGETLVDERFVFDLIDASRNYVSAVVISGGEPLEQLDACKSISRYARSLGLFVGVHTSMRDRALEFNSWFDMVLISNPEIDPSIRWI